jgi:DNA-binding transcriptional LysR family regulator
VVSARLHDRRGLDIVPRLLRTYHERSPEAAVETREYDFSDPTAGLRDKQVHVAVVRPPLGLPGLVSVELATERLAAGWSAIREMKSTLQIVHKQPAPSLLPIDR